MAKDPLSEMSTPASPAATESVAPATLEAQYGTQFFGHPRGLSTLFFTEMWERFSYYGMRALLVLFMTAAATAGGLGFDTGKATAIYGLYTAGVYLFALPGGWLADRLFGQRRAVLYGGVLIMLGHFSLAVPGLPTFYGGLILIVLGTGLLKPNISTMVGELYPEGGARRDAGFSIFYMGINIGAFAGPLICGLLAEKVDWHLGFAAAGVGMLFGLIQYMLTGKYLGEAGLHPDREGTPDQVAARKRNAYMILLVGTVVLGVLGVLMAVGVLGVTAEGLAGVGTFVIVGVALAYFAYIFSLGGLGPVERKRVAVIFVLFIFSAIFWSAFEQAGSSLNLFARDLTDRVYFGWEMPASWLQSVNPILIISLAPVFAWLWIYLNRRRKEPSSPLKFSFGLVFVGLGFLVMVWASVLAVGGEQVSPMWLVLTYLLHTTGELCLSPVGLSTVTKLAPHRMVGQMMGIWFISVSLGNLMAGLVAGYVEEFPLPQVFGIVALVTIVAGLILAAIARPIRRLMSGVH